MIGLDTNILVRLLVEDDPVQTAQAKRFIERRCTPESPGFINCVVLAEFVWVLDSVYQFERTEIAAAIETLLAGRDRRIEYHEHVQAAVAEYRTGSIGFTDAMIARINLARGCEATVTFDRRATKLKGFVRVS
ncbi:MAG: type II toxin-antitoxin system VapC family toxin [Xanthobacteraceae bacterium]